MLEDEHDISFKLKDECEAVAQITSFCSILAHLPISSLQSCPY